MRLFEFDNGINASIIGLVAHLKRKAEKMNKEPKIKTEVFLHMLNNIGVKVNKDGLEQIVRSNPGLKNVFGPIDDNVVSLEPQDDDFGMEPEMDMDIDMDGEEAGGEPFDDEMGMGDEEPEAGATTDDYEVDEPEVDPEGSTDEVQRMAKRALAKRQG